MENKNTAAIVEARAVTFAYSREAGFANLAIRGIDLTVKEGEFLAVLGHNGSGKSTFARLINALEVPSGGLMLIDGMNTAEEENTFRIRKTAGMVFQNPDNQLVATVVEEDVAFGPENLGVPPEEISRRVEESLAAVDMGEFRHRAPHMLSGGQKQRIAIAGVLAMHPRMIVFDEATAMLDPQGRHEIMSIIHRLNREESMTVIIITHYMEEAVGADRVVVLNDGAITAMGAPRDVLHRGEALREAGLLPPLAVRLADELISGGIEADGLSDVLTGEELVDAICR